jgi:hypothetical protein
MGKGKGMGMGKGQGMGMGRFTFRKERAGCFFGTLLGPLRQRPAAAPCEAHGPVGQLAKRPVGRNSPATMGC